MISLVKFLKKVRYTLEFVLVYLFFTVFRVIPVEYASRLVAFIVKNTFYIHKANSIIKNNLRLSFKNKSDADIDDTADKVWENMGMTFAEFPFFCRISKKDFDKRVEIVGLEHIEKLMKANKPFIMFSAHFSNWEVVYTMFRLLNMRGNMIFRPNSNKLLDNYTVKMRKCDKYKFQPKGSAGLKVIVDSLRKGQSLATFIDQKYNEGISVPFLGREAMTPPLIANLSLKHNYPIIPIHAVRTGVARYKIIIDPVLTYKEGKDNSESIYNIMLSANRIIDKWVKKNPEQWFWVHNRWPK